MKIYVITMLLLYVLKDICAGALECIVKFHCTIMLAAIKSKDISLPLHCYCCKIRFLLTFKLAVFKQAGLHSLVQDLVSINTAPYG